MCEAERVSRQTTELKQWSDD